MRELKGCQKKENLNFYIKEVFSKAKFMRYYPKIMRKILYLRKMNIGERLEQEAILNTFMNALGID